MRPADPVPPSHPGAPSAVDDDPSSLRQRLVFVILCTAVGAVAALPAAWAWARLADSPTAALTATGLSFGEREFDRVAGVTLWFLVIGLVFGLVLGGAVGWMGRRHGVVTVIAVVALCLAGSGLTQLFGTQLFGPAQGIDMVELFTSDSRAPLRDAAVGDVIRSELAVRSNVAYLGWPIGGMIGAIAGISGWSKRQMRPVVAPASSNLGPQSSSSPIS